MYLRCFIRHNINICHHTKENKLLLLLLLSLRKVASEYELGKDWQLHNIACKKYRL